MWKRRRLLPETRHRFYCSLLNDLLLLILVCYSSCVALTCIGYARAMFYKPGNFPYGGGSGGGFQWGGNLGCGTPSCCCGYGCCCPNCLCCTSGVPSTGGILPYAGGYGSGMCCCTPCCNCATLLPDFPANLPLNSGLCAPPAPVATPYAPATTVAPPPMAPLAGRPPGVPETQSSLMPLSLVCRQPLCTCPIACSPCMCLRPIATAPPPPPTAPIVPVPRILQPPQPCQMQPRRICCLPVAQCLLPCRAVARACPACCSIAYYDDDDDYDDDTDRRSIRRKRGGPLYGYASRRTNCPPLTRRIRLGGTMLSQSGQSKGQVCTPEDQARCHSRQIIMELLCSKLRRRLSAIALQKKYHEW